MNHRDRPCGFLNDIGTGIVVRSFCLLYIVGYGNILLYASSVHHLSGDGSCGILSHFFNNLEHLGWGDLL